MQNKNQNILTKTGEKLGGKTWIRNLFSAHAAPRVKSRFAVGGSRRGLPKMLKTRSLRTTWVCNACGPAVRCCH